MRTIVFILTGLLSAAPALTQSNTTGKASASGTCNQVSSGSHNKFMITCIVNDAEGKEMLQILNKVLKNQLDAGTVMQKLDEILAAKQTVVEPISADHGIAVGGNARVQNPVVNNYAPLQRKLNPQDRNDNLAILSRNTSSKVDVTAPMGDNEAQQLALALYLLFKDARWSMANPIPMSYMKVGAPVTEGITLYTHGTPPTSAETVTLTPDDPLNLVITVLRKENLAFTLQRRENTPEGRIDIDTGISPRN